jgi:hypothetical protein
MPSVSSSSRKAKRSATISEQLQRRYPDWDRQYVGILQSVPLYGLETVEAACGRRW